MVFYFRPLAFINSKVLLWFLNNVTVIFKTTTTKQHAANLYPKLIVVSSQDEQVVCKMYHISILEKLKIIRLKQLSKKQILTY